MGKYACWLTPGGLLSLFSSGVDAGVTPLAVGWALLYINMEIPYEAAGISI